MTVFVTVSVPPPLMAIPPPLMLELLLLMTLFGNPEGRARHFRNQSESLLQIGEAARNEVIIHSVRRVYEAGCRSSSARWVLWVN